MKTAMLITLLSLSLGAMGGASAAAAAPAGAASPDPSCTPHSRLPGRGEASTAPASGIGGTTTYARGTFVHQDYIYDDHGAAGVKPGRVADSTARPAGSYVYPLDEPRFVNNAADLRELRLRLDGTDLVIEAYLQTLTAPDTTAISVGFDVEGTAELPVPFPHRLGVSLAGLDVAVTFWGTGASLTRSGQQPRPLATASADVDRNVLTARVPLDDLGASGDTFAVAAAAGLWDGGGEFLPVLPVPTSTMPGGRQVVRDVRAFDVAFHPGEHGPDQWFDEQQAAALAAGDVSGLTETVDLAAMRAGADRPWRPEAGFYEAIHRSEFTLGPYHEGWTAAVGFQGEYQPFGLYVPRQVADGTPLALSIFYHGATRNHTNLIGGDNMQSQLGDELGALLVAPLARRAVESEYDDERMADTREVLAETHRRFDVDPNRRYLTGYSQGGNGVYRAMTFTADEWAAGTIWAGQNPDALPWLDSSRWVPTILLHSPADELVPYTESFRTHQRLDELGYEHELRTHGGEHEYQAVTDDYRQPAAWFAPRVRDPHPPRVTYARVPAEDELDFGLVFDSAYWLHRIEAADARGVVDALSHGIGGELPEVQDVLSAEPGPNGPYLRDGLAYVRPGTPIEPGNRLDLTLEKISGLVVDAQRARLTLDQPLELSVVTDGPVSVTLAATSALPPRLEGDGALSRTDCGWTITYGAAGGLRTVLRPAASGADQPAAGAPGPTAGDASRGAGGTLPATGGTPAAIALTLLVFGVLARRSPRVSAGRRTLRAGGDMTRSG